MPDGQEPILERYAVVFRTGTTGPTAGGLVVGESCFVLAGGNADDPIELTVAFSELREVRIGHSSAERLNGRPTLLLNRHEGPLIQVVPLGFGLLHELADLLTQLAIRAEDPGDEIAVVVPLKAGCVGRVRELVAKGPPFDPATLALQRHRVFVSEGEAIFVFAGPNVRQRIARATLDPTFWQAGLAWKTCIAGQPRLLTPREAVAAHHGQPLYDWNQTQP